MWLDRWRALAERIDGLEHAVKFFVETMVLDKTDNYNLAKRVLGPEWKALSESIERFGREFHAELPVEAREAIRHYVEGRWAWEDNNIQAYMYLQRLVPLFVFKSQFEHAIRDAEVGTRSLVGLAFEHLGRQLRVDEPLRQKWLEAFDRHETKCEQLGAVHLLGHGIWAFKVTGEGAATDLVCSEPMTQHIEQARHVARAAVLTEWKCVKTGDARGVAVVARRQMKLYAAGALGGLELKNTRYVVLVASGGVESLPDEVDGTVTYRHVLIQLTPDSPSKEAKKSGRTAAGKRP